MTNTADLDKKDFALLEALQLNASRRLEDLAKLVRLAPSSVHDRLRRLESLGVLRKWTIDVDHQALGFGVIAFVGVRASRPCSEMMESLRTIRSIEECHSVAGDLSMVLKVRVARTSDLLKLVDQLRQIPGITETETTIVLQTQFERPIGITP